MYISNCSAAGEIDFSGSILHSSDDGLIIAVTSKVDVQLVCEATKIDDQSSSGFTQRCNNVFFMFAGEQPIYDSSKRTK
jgi:hypothetical protein